MKILISSDDYCYKLGDDYYLRDFGMVLAHRYLMSFDEVRMAIRTKVVKSKTELGKYNIRVSNPRIEIFPVKFFQGPLQYLKAYLIIKKQLRKVCDGCQISILRLPSTTAFAVWERVFAKGLPYGTELVFDCYDAYCSSESKLYKYLWYRLYKKQVKACNHASGIAPVTEHYLQQRYWSTKLDAINSHYSSIEMTNDFFLQPRTFPKKDFIDIIHVANQIQFNGRKGHNDLLLALKRLKEIGLKVRVTFIGEDYQNGIAQLTRMAESLDVADMIQFTGFLKYCDMREVLRQSDIAVLPTKAEGLPRVVIEAMAMGLPCLTTRVSGNPELVEEKFLFEYGDIDSIVQGIGKLCCNHELYCYTSQRNFNRSQEYKKDVLDSRRKDFYDSLIKIVERKHKYKQYKKKHQ